MVEQKVESKGRSESRVSNRKAHSGLRDAARDGSGRKKQGCGERLLEKTCRMMCDCIAELGVDRKWTL